MLCSPHPSQFAHDEAIATRQYGEYFAHYLRVIIQIKNYYPFPLLFTPAVYSLGVRGLTKKCRRSIEEDDAGREGVYRGLRSLATQEWGHKSHVPLNGQLHHTFFNLGNILRSKYGMVYVALPQR